VLLVTQVILFLGCSHALELVDLHLNSQQKLFMIAELANIMQEINKERSRTSIKQLNSNHTMLPQMLFFRDFPLKNAALLQLLFSHPNPNVWHYRPHQPRLQSKHPDPIIYNQGFDPIIESLNRFP